MTPKSRCEKNYEYSIHNKETRKNYQIYLKKFMKFVQVEKMEELLQSDQKNIQEKIQDYVHYLDGKISPNSFGVQLAPIFLFYTMNDVILNIKKIKKMIPPKVKKQGFNAYTRENIVELLSNTNKKRTHTMIYILASTGCRKSGLCELKLKDIFDIPNSECKCLRFYAGDVSEYFGFLTPEAVKNMNSYLDERKRHGEKLTPESPVIALYQNYKDLPNGDKRPIKPTKPITPIAVSNAITIIFEHQKPRGKDIGNRYLIPTVHGFRKYFNKTLKMRDGCNISKIEKLLSHKLKTIPLDNHYLPMDKEDTFQEFVKSIPDLTIGEEERQLLKIKELEKVRMTEVDKTKENKLLKEEMELLIHRMEILENTKNV